jgi:quinolinate synthase
MLFQPPLPPKYRELSDDEMAQRIRAHKEAFGRRLVILGHHYQQDEVIQFADFTGDSLKLSQLAARQKDAEFVVFCGVHFMAESADILTGDDVTVILPDLSAGCSMADMAAIEQLEDAWEHLTGVLGTAATEGGRYTGETPMPHQGYTGGMAVPHLPQRVIPITYVNSAASIKAFCGRHGGACCTSSNARKVLEWALTRGDKVIFLPDQHLGRNTAYAMGWPLESMVVYDPHHEDGGLTDEQVEDARFFLWKGHCSVHGLFTEKHCDEIRRTDPECRILVHPECKWEVVQKADLAGSTEYIIRTLDEAPDGTRWAVGTEMHLVNRLAQKYAGRKSIRSLAGMQCLCTTMYRIDMPHLLWCLDELAAGRIVNQIRVDDETKHDSRIALQRMLDNVSAVPVAAK